MPKGGHLSRSKRAAALRAAASLSAALEGLVLGSPRGPRAGRRITRGKHADSSAPCTSDPPCDHRANCPGAPAAAPAAPVAAPTDAAVEAALVNHSKKATPAGPNAPVTNRALAVGQWSWLRLPLPTRQANSPAVQRACNNVTIYVITIRVESHFRNASASTFQNKDIRQAADFGCSSEAV
jgi:hypothetical protein